MGLGESEKAKSLEQRLAAKEGVAQGSKCLAMRNFNSNSSPFSML